MAETHTEIHLDAELTREAQELLHDLGMDLTTAVTIFLRQTVREQSFPFTIRRDTVNRETAEALAEFEDMKSRPDRYPRYDSFSDAMNDVFALKSS